MDWEKIAIFFATLICIAITCAILFKTTQPIEVKLNGYTMTKSDIMKGDLTDFVLVGQRFAKTHQWTENYTCMNYTQDLEKIAEELGFKVKVIHGWTETNDSGHAWIRLAVDYEPQTGTFTDYSYIYPNQKEVR